MIEEMDYRDFFREFVKSLIIDMDEFIKDIDEGKLYQDEIIDNLTALNQLLKLAHERTDVVFNKVSIKFEE
jgi:hypothetical protein